MALIDGFMTIVGAVTGMGKSGQDDVLAGGPRWNLKKQLHKL